jgi:hypothetical protein
MKKIKPIIVLDVDGVLNPFWPRSTQISRDWVFDKNFSSSPESGSFLLNLSTEMGQALRDLDCDIRWLSTWMRDGDFANQEIGEALGWPVLPNVEIEFHGPNDFSWKPRAVRQILSTDGPPVIWIDDDAVIFLKDLTDLSFDPHQRLLPIAPDTDVGLTKKDIEKAKDFISERL